MAFSFSDEQIAFRDVVRRFMDDRSPVTEVRRLMDSESGFDEDVWRQACGELGLAGIGLDERFGGAGFGLVELGIVAEELGRALYCGPYFSSVVLGARSILNVGTDAEREAMLPALAAGSRRATLAFHEPLGSWNLDDIQCSCVDVDGELQLSGSKTLVVDGLSAEMLLVVVREQDGCGLSLVCVGADARGLERNATTPLDPTRKLATVSFNATPAIRVGPAGGAAGGIRQTLREACVVLAHESVGGAQQLFDTTLEYTLMRVQFGRVIGSFQAIKHQCAELLLDLELSKSAAYSAAEALDDADANAHAAASLAKASCSDHYMRMAASCIQLHGGIGFTWEQDTHLWYKRAKSSEVFLGTPAYHRELMMQNWVDIQLDNMREAKA
jgi:alkylation response protein AidB-like acyl-CoA dehydrogenase